MLGRQKEDNAPRRAKGADSMLGPGRLTSSPPPDQEADTILASGGTHQGGDACSTHHEEKRAEAAIRQRWRVPVFVWEGQVPGSSYRPNGSVKPNAYGPGVGMDKTGRRVRARDPFGSPNGRR